MEILPGQLDVSENSGDPEWLAEERPRRTPFVGWIPNSQPHPNRVVQTVACESPLAIVQGAKSTAALGHEAVAAGR